MTIRDWPADEIPRKKKCLRAAHPRYRTSNCWHFFFGSGQRGQTAIDLGRELLSQLGGLKPLLEPEPTTLTALPRLGAAKA